MQKAIISIIVLFILTASTNANQYSNYFDINTTNYIYSRFNTIFYDGTKFDLMHGISRIEKNDLVKQLETSTNPYYICNVLFMLGHYNNGYLSRLRAEQILKKYIYNSNLCIRQTAVYSYASLNPNKAIDCYIELITNRQYCFASNELFLDYQRLYFFRNINNNDKQKVIQIYSNILFNPETLASQSNINNEHYMRRSISDIRSIFYDFKEDIIEKLYLDYLSTHSETNTWQYSTIIFYFIRNSWDNNSQIMSVLTNIYNQSHDLDFKEKLLKRMTREGEIWGLERAIEQIKEYTNVEQLGGRAELITMIAYRFPVPIVYGKFISLITDESNFYANTLYMYNLIHDEYLKYKEKLHWSKRHRCFVGGYEYHEFVAESFDNMINELIDAYGNSHYRDSQNDQSGD